MNVAACQHIYSNLHLCNSNIWFPEYFSGKINPINTTEFLTIPRNVLIVPPLKEKKRKEMWVDQQRERWQFIQTKSALFLRQNSPYQAKRKEPVAGQFLSMSKKVWQSLSQSLYKTSCKYQNSSDKVLKRQTRVR